MPKCSDHDLVHDLEPFHLGLEKHQSARFWLVAMDANLIVWKSIIWSRLRQHEKQSWR